MEGEYGLPVTLGHHLGIALQVSHIIIFYWAFLSIIQWQKWRVPLGGASSIKSLRGKFNQTQVFLPVVEIMNRNTVGPTNVGVSWASSCAGQIGANSGFLGPIKLTKDKCWSFLFFLCFFMWIMLLNYFTEGFIYGRRRKT